MKILQPIRMGLIKRYFDKFKMQKSKREEILAAAEESEGVVKEILGEEYRHFTELLPEIKEFLDEHTKKEAVKLDQQLTRTGTKVGKLTDLSTLQGKISTLQAANKRTIQRVLSPLELAKQAAK